MTGTQFVRIESDTRTLRVTQIGDKLEDTAESFVYYLQSLGHSEEKIKLALEKTLGAMS